MRNNKLNVILITIDALRPDFVGCYTDKHGIKGLTPNLDRFANNGIIFKKAFAQGSATPHTIRCLLTSRYNSRLSGAVSITKGLRVTMTMLKGGTSFAEVLKQHGYQTAGIHSNPYLSSALHYNRGFDTFIDEASYMSAKGPWLFRVGLNKLQRMIKSSPYLTSEEINRRAISWLKTVDPPFFLWVHYMEPHGPFINKDGINFISKIRGERLWRKAISNPKSINDEEYNRLLEGYKKNIKYLDYNLGKFVKELSNMELFNDTIFIITSDHGTEFREHGDFGHGSKLYDELISIPLIIRYPKCKPMEITTPVRAIDIAPTVLDILKINPIQEFLGSTLLPIIDGKDNGDMHVISEVIPPSKKEVKLISVRTKKWKYILDNLRNRVELYNLNEDPKERINLANKKQNIRMRFEKILKKHIEKEKDFEIKFLEQKNFEDESIMERLKHLGYLD